MIGFWPAGGALWQLAVVVVLVLIGGAPYFAGYKIGKGEGREEEVLEGKRSKKWQRAVLGGCLISEQVAAFLPGFPPDLKASEAR